MDRKHGYCEEKQDQATINRIEIIQSTLKAPEKKKISEYVVLQHTHEVKIKKSPLRKRKSKNSI